MRCRAMFAEDDPAKRCVAVRRHCMTAASWHGDDEALADRQDNAQTRWAVCHYRSARFTVTMRRQIEAKWPGSMAQDSATRRCRDPRVCE
ncbi:hypothetical protein HBH56_024760 [Parastagonospora nodorum]|uniref:Uncharacterized protein n=1 Tax=Phaeosphaeria nodorum (strain SN15 / ATCC MYA-4574 / FGSC 10173) TaxID=321614 RepID=A0A7U2F979_PHANO|nr:hypothetical protein HBH56_024760 [Parastagonospora nodorum]QRC98825.1 hypothetical protein JI435_304500 [Parastagonospora nodorum SN15]KAH3934566.1 hypothetical protein HBH54_057240 [Parastagonospora nodorum]KAH3949791.1 hypothetical protein HBH53_084930 [Parastagonospora nodorum]KAH3975891.1 hypothetical protein HBH51_080420 [Parastagonospora nodorum]